MKICKSLFFFSLPLQSLQNIKFDNVAQFLPPGFKVNPEEKEQPPSTTRRTTTTNDPTTTRSSGVPKLSLANLFGDIKNDDLSGLLPPGFNPDKEDRTTTKSTSTRTTGGLNNKYFS